MQRNLINTGWLWVFSFLHPSELKRFRIVYIFPVRVHQLLCYKQCFCCTSKNIYVCSFAGRWFWELDVNLAGSSDQFCIVLGRFNIVGTISLQICTFIWGTENVKQNTKASRSRHNDRFVWQWSCDCSCSSYFRWETLGWTSGANSVRILCIFKFDISVHTIGDICDEVDEKRLTICKTIVM